MSDRLAELEWYEANKPRPLAFTSCPDDGFRVAVVYAREGQLLIWDAGYRMTPAESHREEIALEVGVIWDAEERPPTEEEYAEILERPAGRIVQEPNVRPGLPFSTLASCKRCRTSYQLDTAGLIAAAASAGKACNVPPARRCTMTQLVAEQIRRHANSTMPTPWVTPLQ